MSERSKLNRRTFLGGAAAAAAVAATSACNLAGGGGGGGGGGNDDGGGTGATLNVWGGVPNETGPDALCAAFMDEFPDIQVTYTRYVNDDEGNIKLDTSLTGGAGIDMYFSYNPARMLQRADAGLAIDVTEKIAAESDFAQFAVDADPIGNYVRDGKLFAIPAARAPVHVYINKQMMDAAGITLGTSWTVDEFVDVARQLTGDGVFGTLNYPPQARVMIGPDYRYADDGARSNFADPWFSRELELALSLQAEGVKMDQETIIAEQLQTFSQNPFIAGRVAILIASGQIIRSINDTTEYPHDFQTYCMPLPTPDTSTTAWNTGQLGDLISVNPQSQYQDEAWELAKFWVRNAAEFMTPGGRLPALAGETSEDEILASLLSENAEELYDVESWRSMLFSPDLVLPVDSIFTAGTQIDSIMTTLTDEYLLGDRPLDSWVSEAVAQSDAAIANGGA
jgi:multiple sugar transport system substrate-binding protein